MSSAAIGIGLLLLMAVVAIIAVTLYYLRTGASSLSPELEARRDALRDRLRAVLGRVPSKRSLEDTQVPDHERAAAIEAKLLRRDPRGALAEAEALLGEAADDPRVHVLLARALVYCDELPAAADELSRARGLGDTSPMLDYLDGRVRHLRALRRANAGNAEVQTTPVPSLITPFEIFILQLERQRRISEQAAAVWLAGATDSTLDHDDIVALVTDHFTGYYDSLDLLLSAVEAQPGFADALYHTARLALKVGFIEPGRALLEAIEPLMEGSLDAEYYRRDLAHIRDETLSAEVSPMPQIAPGAKRSISLKVIP